jgi:hypothetical protein
VIGEGFCGACAVFIEQRKDRILLGFLSFKVTKACVHHAFDFHLARTAPLSAYKVWTVFGPPFSLYCSGVDYQRGRNLKATEIKFSWEVLRKIFARLHISVLGTIPYRARVSISEQLIK